MDERAVMTSTLELDMENYREGAMKLLELVRPKWDQSRLTVKEFTNGITNKMLGFMQGTQSDDMVLIRINGNKTEIFLDRDNEVNSFKILHNAGCAPNLYCVFGNGLCYEYVQGNTITRDQVRKPEIYKLITNEMVKMHKIRLQESTNSQRPVAFSLIDKFLNLRFSPDAPPGRGLEGYTGPSEKELRSEARSLEDHLMKLGSPIVFCHNDLLLNNIIFNENRNTVHFIDYEYAGMNNQAFDIGNHFCEFAGVDDLDYSFYPDRQLQLLWLKEYLKHWKGVDSTGANVTEQDIERLYVQVNKFSLAAHVMWGTWALVQANFSSIDFDFLGYASQRFKEYFKHRDEFFALQMPC